MAIGPIGEAIVSNHVLADVVTKTAYFSLAAAALIFVSLLFLTTLHP
jgi:hypothetical protein